MALPRIADEAIVLGYDAADWRSAVLASGEALAAAGAATPAYSDEMIRMIEEHGPYIVIAPGLALAHARPGPTVLDGGLAVVTLATPVAFGHAHNDPVSVVLGLAIASASDHLEMIADIANVFNDSNVVAELAAAETPADVRHIMGSE